MTEPLYDPTCDTAIPGECLVIPGEVRKQTWDELQPKLTLRYRPTDTLTIYGDYSRGFRSGGFNQSGVGAAVPEPGVEDVFEKQVADTYEAGIKGVLRRRPFLDLAERLLHRLRERLLLLLRSGRPARRTSAASLKSSTPASNSKAARCSTTTSAPTYGIGYTDGEIQRAADPADNGNQAPLVTEWTFNLGGQFPVPGWIRRHGLRRCAPTISYQGDTYWDPGNISVRSPDQPARHARGTSRWRTTGQFTLWGRNLTDERYNGEFSPGPAPGR